MVHSAPPRPTFRVSGETDIDVSEADYTTNPGGILLTVTAVADIEDLRIELDLHKATTGFAAVNTSQTVTLRHAFPVDGTNYRTTTGPFALTALSGTNAANRGWYVAPGPLKAGQSVRIYVILSAETGGDCEIPYAVTGHSYSAPTVTPVAAA